jgi:hypothetical protein
MFIISFFKSPSIIPDLKSSSNVLLYFSDISLNKIRNLEIGRYFTFILIQGYLVHIISNECSQSMFCLILQKNWFLLKYLIIFVCGIVTKVLINNTYQILMPRIVVVDRGLISSVLGGYLSLILIYCSRMNDQF